MTPLAFRGIRKPRDGSEHGPSLSFSPRTSPVSTVADPKANPAPPGLRRRQDGDSFTYAMPLAAGSAMAEEEDICFPFRRTACLSRREVPVGQRAGVHVREHIGGSLGIPRGGRTENPAENPAEIRGKNHGKSYGATRNPVRNLFRFYIRKKTEDSAAVWHGGNGQNK